MSVLNFQFLITLRYPWQPGLRQIINCQLLIVNCCRNALYMAIGIGKKGGEERGMRDE